MAAPGSLVADRYRLVRQLGAGGMGVVWEARDERLHRTVAVKQLRTQNGLTDAETAVFAQRAMREARITARLQHPYAVSVFDVVEDDEGRPCIVMELVPSVPLSEVLRELQTLEPSEAARVGSQVAAALAAAHALGIVHRDVKPGNVLIGDDGTARICDFGISRALGDTTLTMTGMITGTPAYLAPEVARGEEAGSPADVYSLGATLYAAVEGVPPFGTDGNAIALLYRVTSGTMRPPERAGDVGPLLLAMLSANPQDRPTMTEVAGELARLTDSVPAPRSVGQPAPASEPLSAREPATPLLLPALPAESAHSPAPSPSPVPSPSPAPPPRPTPSTATSSPQRRRPLLVAGVVTVVLLIGIVAAVLWSNGSDPSTGSSPKDLASTATTSTAPTTSSEAPSAVQPTAEELAQAVVDYYALLPDDTDAGWQLLTPAYQQQTGGQDSYERFWNDVDTVTVSDVRSTLPDQVQATITYVQKSGNQRSTERRSFQLVDSGGTLKINKSSVI